MANYHPKYELHYAAGKALRQACSRTLQAENRLSARARRGRDGGADLARPRARPDSAAL